MSVSSTHTNQVWLLEAEKMLLDTWKWAEHRLGSARRVNLSARSIWLSQAQKWFNDPVRSACL